MNPLLIQLAIKEAPAIIVMLKRAFQRDHPDEPVPTDAEVIAAHEEAYRASKARNAAWLAAHPDV